MKRPAAATDMIHDKDGGGEEGEEEEDISEDGDEEEEDAKVVKKKPSGVLCDRSEAKKFSEIWDDLPGDTKTYFAGLKSRGAQSVFIISLIDRKGGKLHMNKTALLKTKVTRTEGDMT